MADLRRDRRRRRDRGQILLIAAFTLAVTFVALAMVVNSAIFTENLASRGEVSGSSEALTYQHQVHQSVGEAMAYANRHDFANLGSSITDSVEAIGRQGGTQQVRGGQVVHVRYVSRTAGTRIADNASGGSTFESDGGRADWNLAGGVDETRNFVVTTESGDLPTSPVSAFTVEANETGTVGNVWSLSIWQDGGDVVLDVNTADGVTATCRQDVSGTGEFDVDVTRGLVDGKRCHALTRAGPGGTPTWLGAGIPAGSDYDIDFERGDAIQGTYSLVVSPQSSWNASTLGDGPAVGTPFRTDAIYSTTVAYAFQTTQVTYETRIRVAPGETP